MYVFTEQRQVHQCDLEKLLVALWSPEWTFAGLQFWALLCWLHFTAMDVTAWLQSKRLYSLFW